MSHRLIDQQELVQAAARYHGAIGRARALAGTRALSEGPTAGELLLESQWERDLRPALSELYTRPIAAGIGTLATMSRAEMARWVLGYYEEQGAVEGLRRPARAYARRAFDLGGQMGLDELGLEGFFQLSDETVIGKVDGQVERLVDTRRGARRSAVVTTAEEIAAEVERQREDGVEAADMLPLLSAWVLGRTVIRSALIAATESVRMTRWGMVWAFVGNGIRGVRHECEPDVDRRCMSGVCPPLCGTEYELRGVFNPMGGISAAAQIPLHSRCRCYYSSLQDGWVKPALIWTGFALGALD